MAINRTKVQALAQKYVLKGLIDKAIREYILLYEDDPKDSKTCQKLGDLYARKGDKVKAAEYYEKTAKHFTDKGFYLKSIAVYKQILRLDPAQINLLLVLGDLYHRQGLPSESIAQYRQAAAYYEKQGNVREALETIRKMANLDPSNVMIRVKLAESFIKEGLKEQALEEILKVGDEYRKKEKYDDLIKLYEKFASLDQSNKAVLKELGNAYLKTGDDNNALMRMKQALKADPDDIDTLTIMSSLYKKLGDLDKAKSSLQQILRVQPTLIKARRELIDFCIEDGDVDKAISELEMIIDLHLKNESFDDVFELIQFAKKKFPDNARVLGKICETYWITKDEEKLVSSYKELARLYEENGNQEKSHEVYRRILELRPDDEDARKIENLEGGEQVSVEEVSTVEDGPLSGSEITKALTEIDVQIKYGMEGKAEEGLKNILRRNPENIGAHLKLKDLLLGLQRNEEAIEELLALVDIYEGLDEKDNVITCLKEILTLDPEHEDASRLYASMAVEEEQENIEIDVEEEIPFDIELEIEGEPEEIETVSEPEEIEAVSEPEEIEAVSEPEEIEAVSEPEEIEAVIEPEEIEALSELEEIEAVEEVEEPEEIEVVEEEPTHNIIDDISPLGEDEIVEAVTALEAVHEGVGITATAQPLTLADIGEKFEEAEFYIDQELYDKAKTVLYAVLEIDPENSLAHEKLADISSREEAAGVATLESGEDFFDLASEIMAESSSMPSSDEEGGELLGFDALFDSFKEGVAAQISTDDSETHYNLGIAYKEMGLYDDAIKEFMLAMKDPKKVFDGYSMMGLCCMDKGLPVEAIEYFMTGLESDGISDEAQLSLTYELGLAYKAADMMDEARDVLAKVYDKNKTFRDIEKQFMDIGGLGGEGVDADTTNMETVSEKDIKDPPNPKSKDKVSYI